MRFAFGAACLVCITGFAWAQTRNDEKPAAVEISRAC
jgi:hypothetical protein